MNCSLKTIYKSEEGKDAVKTNKMFERLYSDINEGKISLNSRADIDQFVKKLELVLEKDMPNQTNINLS